MSIVKPGIYEHATGRLIITAGPGGRTTVQATGPCLFYFNEAGEPVMLPEPQPKPTIALPVMRTPSTARVTWPSEDQEDGQPG